MTEIITALALLVATIATTFFIGGACVWVIYDVIAVAMIHTLPYLNFWMCGILGFAIRWLLRPFRVSVSKD